MAKEIYGGIQYNQFKETVSSGLNDVASGLNDVTSGLGELDQKLKIVSSLN